MMFRKKNVLLIEERLTVALLLTKNRKSPLGSLISASYLAHRIGPMG